VRVVRSGGPHTWDFVPGSDARCEIPSTATERAEGAPPIFADADLPDEMRGSGREEQAPRRVSQGPSAASPSQRVAVTEAIARSRTRATASIGLPPSRRFASRRQTPAWLRPFDERSLRNRAAAACRRALLPLVCSVARTTPLRHRRRMVVTSASTLSAPQAPSR
jgi:hypothetical protein